MQCVPSMAKYKRLVSKSGVTILNQTVKMILILEEAVGDSTLIRRNAKSKYLRLFLNYIELKIQQKWRETVKWACALLSKQPPN